MLRLNPTQIRLEARDLAWHINRHHERQSLRAQDARVQVESIPSKRLHDNGGLTPTHQLSGSPIPFRQLESRDGLDAPLVSSEPVPQGSRAFWDRILAEAGTPTRTKNTPHASGRVIERSDDWLEDHRSSRASPERSDSDIQDDVENDSGYGGEPEPSIVPEKDETGGHHLKPPSTDSFHSALAMRAGSANTELTSTLYEAGHRSLTRNRISSFFHRNPSPSNHQYFHGHGDLDGPSDSYLEPYHRVSSESSSSPRPRGNTIGDNLYGDPHDRRTISSNLEAYVNQSEDVQDMDTNLRVSPQSGLPQPLLLPVAGPIDLSVRRSSALPGSRLRISQAAASSSPERCPISSSHHDDVMRSGSGLLSLPPRRPNQMTYRPRSESYSFVASEESNRSTLPQVDGSPMDYTPMMALNPSPIPSFSGPSGSQMNSRSTSAMLHPSFNNDPPSSPPEIPTPFRAPVHTLFNSPQGSRTPSSMFDPTLLNARLSNYANSHRSGSSPSLPISNPNTPSHRNLSPLASEFIPSSTSHRNISPQLPRYPFSATPRNVSFNLPLPLPTSSTPPPIYIETPHPTPHQTSSSSPAPHTPSSSWLTPQTPPPWRNSSRSPGPTGPRLTIYNDRLPPASQPQTPADLTRRSGNVRPTAGLAGGLAIHNPFNTAPARVPLNDVVRERGEVRATAQATPTRGPSARVAERTAAAAVVAERNLQAENAGSVSEEDRRYRRARYAGRGSPGRG